MSGWETDMNKKPQHCKGCVLLSAHTNPKVLTEAQKKAHNWCCAKGQPAYKAEAFCKVHSMKKVKT